MMYGEVLYAVAKGNLRAVREEVIRLAERPDFVRWVRFHQMGSLFYDLFPEISGTFLLDRATAMSRWGVWDRLRERLKDSPVPVVAFKGVTVGELYPNRLQRFISDADLWVRREDLDRVTEFLKGVGARWVMDVPGQRIFRYEGLPVEVHTAFTRFPYPSGIGEGDILRHIRRVEGNLFFPDCDLSLSILYVHAYKSMYVRTSFKAIWWHEEGLLLKRGAKPIGGRVVRASARWFSSVKPGMLRGDYLEDSPKNRLLYLWHGLRMLLGLV